MTNTTNIIPNTTNMEKYQYKNIIFVKGFKKKMN